MINKKNFITSVVFGIGAVAVAANPSSAEAKKSDYEKCYGIVKAGQNDCGSKNGSHSCAGGSTKNADANEWILLPKGLCNRIQGGKLDS
ncbi:MAG: DUF2282 domain-containing protein [Proteobacteria bacterium]|nr:DUF2282 domain-containing protein [Pseudomonadota bacterium]